MDNKEIEIIRSRAPLRLGFIGGGTDLSPYCDEHGGVVLNATIDLYAYTILEPMNNGKVHFIAKDRQEDFSSEATSELALMGQFLLHKGVYNRVVREFNHGNPLPVKLTTFSDAPAGSGLGTSSTMVVSILNAFVEWLSLPLGDYDIAHMAYEIERIELGLSGGKQDQYAATFGGVNFMEFYDDDRVVVNPLRIKTSIIAELESSLVLFNTKRLRESATIIDDQVNHLMTEDDQILQLMSRIKEDTFHMKEWLLKGNIYQFGQCLDKAWHEKKRLAGSISNDFIDHVYTTAMQAGAYAGKVSGAGGGGVMMFLVSPEKRMDLIHVLSKLEGEVINCHFIKHGMYSWRV